MSVETPLTAALLASLQGHAHRAAIIEWFDGSSRATSYAELASRAQALRRRLLDLGLRPGDVVPMFVERGADSVALAIAALLEGAAFAWLNNKLQPPQLARIVELAAPFGLVVDSSTASTFDDCEPSLRARLAPAHLAGDLLMPLADLPLSPQRPMGRAAGAAGILFTSGSTGAPKGVLVGGDDLLARARTEVQCYELTEDDALLGVLPFSFDVGLNQLFSSLLSGATLHLTNGWMRDALARTVIHAQITGLSATPGVWTSCLRGSEPGERLFGEAPRLRYVTVSGGSLPKTTFHALAAALGPSVAIHRTYGQSETFRSAIFLGANRLEHLARLDSVGRAVPGTAIWIALDRERLASAGERGEVLHVGDGTMLGYLGDDATEKLGSHAALGAARVVYTGDHGRLDEDGYLYLDGRDDGMLKVHGFRFYPREVEEALASHAAVHEAVAFGVPSPEGGERVVAVVVCAPDVDLADVRRHVAEQLPHYMCPTDLRVVDELAKTTSGKPALAVIKQAYLSQRIR